MPRSSVPQWRQRKEPILDAHIQASVAQSNGQYHPETGHYATLIYAGIETKERADEIKRALHRCATYLGYSMSAKVQKVANGFQVEYRVIDKTMAKKHVLEKYGPDRSKWPYDPRRRNPKVNS